MSTSLYFLRRQKITPSGSCFRQLRPLRPTGKNLLQQLINTITPVLYYHNRGWINQGSTAPCRCIFRPVYVNCISYFNLAIATYTGIIQRVPCSCKDPAAEPSLHHAVLFAALFMLIALILILTWPSPCIQALYVAVLLAATKEPSKAEPSKAPSTEQSRLPSAISHQPSKAESTETKHTGQAPSTSTQNTSTHQPSPSTSKQAPITTYGYIPLFAVFGSLPLFSFLSFVETFFGHTV